MKLHQNLSAYLLVSYLSYMFYRTPQLSDSFIVLGLCALFGFERYMARLESKDPQYNPKAQALRDELELEQIEATIERVKIDRNMNNAKRDAMAAGGTGEEKRFIF
jgi:hypothetical protein